MNDLELIELKRSIENLIFFIKYVKHLDNKMFESYFLQRQQKDRKK